MPARSHSQQQPNNERFARDNSCGVGKQLRLYQLFSLVRLAQAMRRKDGDQPREHQKDSKPGGQSHVITYHSRTFAAIDGNKRMSSRAERGTSHELADHVGHENIRTAAVRSLTPKAFGVRDDTGNQLRNNENLVGPRILHLGAGCVTAHIDVPSTGIKRAEHITRLIRHCFCSWKFRLAGGTSH